MLVCGGTGATYMYIRMYVYVYVYVYYVVSMLLCMGGSLPFEGGLWSPPTSISRSLARRRLISARCISIMRWLSCGSTWARPVGGSLGFMAVRAACWSNPCFRASFSSASRSCACVRVFFSSERRSLISFSSETFSC